MLIIQLVTFFLILTFFLSVYSCSNSYLFLNTSRRHFISMCLEIIGVICLFVFYADGTVGDNFSFFFPLQTSDWIPLVSSSCSFFCFLVCILFLPFFYTYDEYMMTKRSIRFDLNELILNIIVTSFVDTDQLNTYLFI